MSYRPQPEHEIIERVQITIPNLITATHLDQGLRKLTQVIAERPQNCDGCVSVLIIALLQALTEQNTWKTVVGIRL